MFLVCHGLLARSQGHRVGVDSWAWDQHGDTAAPARTKLAWDLLSDIQLFTSLDPLVEGTTVESRTSGVSRAIIE